MQEKPEEEKPVADFTPATPAAAEENKAFDPTQCAATVLPGLGLELGLGAQPAGHQDLCRTLSTTSGLVLSALRAVAPCSVTPASPTSHQVQHHAEHLLPLLRGQGLLLLRHRRLRRLSSTLTESSVSLRVLDSECAAPENTLRPRAVALRFRGVRVDLRPLVGWNYSPQFPPIAKLTTRPERAWIDLRCRAWTRSWRRC